MIKSTKPANGQVYSQYKPKSSYFIAKYLRLLCRTAAARTIGHAGVCLCLQVVVIEDKRRYRSPVRFSNQDLSDRLRVSWRTLHKIRQKAVEAGWLHYEPGSCRGEDGIYWTDIPIEFMDWGDDGDDGRCAQTASVQQSSTISAYETSISGKPHGIGNVNFTAAPSILDPTPGAAHPSDASRPPASSAAQTAQPPVTCPEPAGPASGPEPLADESDPPTGYTFPVTGSNGQHWTLPARKLAEYRDAYPALDIDAELRAARQWCRDNTARRKTARGMPRFLNAWLERSQNHPRPGNGQAVPFHTRCTMQGIREFQETLASMGAGNGQH